jgi:hypothetical protein
MTPELAAIIARVKSEPQYVISQEDTRLLAEAVERLSAIKAGAEAVVNYYETWPDSCGSLMLEAYILALETILKATRTAAEAAREE